jgi:hypothetical protein
MVVKLGDMGEKRKMFRVTSVSPTYLKFGRRKRTLWNKAIFSALPKMQFSLESDEIFFYVVIKHRTHYSVSQCETYNLFSV